MSAPISGWDLLGGFLERGESFLQVDDDGREAVGQRDRQVRDGLGSVGREAEAGRGELEKRIIVAIGDLVQKFGDAKTLRRDIAEQLARAAGVGVDGHAETSSRSGDGVGAPSSAETVEGPADRAGDGSSPDPALSDEGAPGVIHQKSLGGPRRRCGAVDGLGTVFGAVTCPACLADSASGPHQLPMPGPIPDDLAQAMEFGARVAQKYDARDAARRAAAEAASPFVALSDLVSVIPAEVAAVVAESAGPDGGDVTRVYLRGGGASYLLVAAPVAEVIGLLADASWGRP